MIGPHVEGIDTALDLQAIGWHITISLEISMPDLTPSDSAPKALSFLRSPPDGAVHGSATLKM
jgi:hypothetical protein